jgi:peptidoglycan hydrolase CwlO-like protein
VRDNLVTQPLDPLAEAEKAAEEAKEEAEGAEQLVDTCQDSIEKAQRKLTSSEQECVMLEEEVQTLQQKVRGDDNTNSQIEIQDEQLKAATNRLEVKANQR